MNRSRHSKKERQWYGRKGTKGQTMLDKRLHIKTKLKKTQN